MANHEEELVDQETQEPEERVSPQLSVGTAMLRATLPDWDCTISLVGVPFFVLVARINWRITSSCHNTWVCVWISAITPVS